MKASKFMEILAEVLVYTFGVIASGAIGAAFFFLMLTIF